MLCRVFVRMYVFVTLNLSNSILQNQIIFCKNIAEAHKNYTITFMSQNKYKSTLARSE